MGRLQCWRGSFASSHFFCMQYGQWMHRFNVTEQRHRTIAADMDFLNGLICRIISGEGGYSNPFISIYERKIVESNFPKKSGVAHTRLQSNTSCSVCCQTCVCFWRVLSFLSASRKYRTSKKKEMLNGIISMAESKWEILCTVYRKCFIDFAEMPRCWHFQAYVRRPRWMEMKW